MQSNTTQYFNNFSMIKEVPNAKSLTYCYSDENTQFNDDLLLEFRKILKVEHTFRLLLHTSAQDTLHNMIIAMDNAKFVYPHKHEKSESYHIIEGSLLLVYFKENGEISKFIVLSKKDTIISRVDRNQYHAIIALSDYAIFHEIRTGPFKTATDSFFAPWIDEDKNAYMNKLLNTYKGTK